MKKDHLYSKKFVLMISVILISYQSHVYPSEIVLNRQYSNKSAAEFVSFLEQHDFWRRASSKGNDAQSPPELESLQLANTELKYLVGYERIHVDYGEIRRERDPMHRFTVLMLEFKEKEKIPLVNNELLQEYPLGSWKELVFPLENFASLVHQRVRWEYREYIEWYAIRYGSKVFILYTIPVMWMSDIPKWGNLLRMYLEADMEDKLQNFVKELKSHKSQSLIDYDSIRVLQNTLQDCGFDPGPVDGIWGSSTQKALAEFLEKSEIERSAML